MANRRGKRGGKRGSSIEPQKIYGKAPEPPSERPPGQSIPSSTPPPTIENNRQEGWWRRLLQQPNVVVTAVLILLLGIAVTFGVSKFGENIELKSQLERREERIRNQDQELQTLRKKNEELVSLHPIFQFYGTNTKVVASFDLKKEKGEQIFMGNCPKVPCLIFEMGDIRKDMHGIDIADLLVTGVWEGMAVLDKGAMNIPLPLKKGCRTSFSVSRYDVNFVIEDDRTWSMRTGIGISLASSPQEGIFNRGTECP